MSRPIEDYTTRDECYAIQLGDGEIFGGDRPFMAGDMVYTQKALDDLTSPLIHAGIPENLFPKIVKVVITASLEITDANPSA